VEQQKKCDNEGDVSAGEKIFPSSNKNNKKQAQKLNQQRYDDRMPSVAKTSARATSFITLPLKPVDINLPQNALFLLLFSLAL
jgi:hypothetical protein